MAATITMHTHPTDPTNHAGPTTGATPGNIPSGTIPIPDDTGSEQYTRDGQDTGAKNRNNKFTSDTQGLGSVPTLPGKRFGGLYDIPRKPTPS